MKHITLLAVMIVLTTHVIAQRSYGLVTPNGGEAWEAGDINIIEFWGGYYFPETYNIYYSLDSGSTWFTVVNKFRPSEKNSAGNWIYRWDTPWAFSKKCLIRIISPFTSDADTSEAVFSIAMNNNTGVPDHKQTYFSVSPNPAHDFLNLKLSGKDFSAYFCAVYSITGRLIMRQPLRGDLNLDISSLVSGFYFVTLEDKDGSSLETKKVLVN